MQKTKLGAGCDKKSKKSVQQEIMNKNKSHNGYGIAVMVSVILFIAALVLTILGVVWLAGGDPSRYTASLAMTISGILLLLISVVFGCCSLTLLLCHEATKDIPFLFWIEDP